jgi:hypothetical protein
MQGSRIVDRRLAGIRRLDQVGVDGPARGSSAQDLHVVLSTIDRAIQREHSFHDTKTALRCLLGIEHHEIRDSTSNS